ncbi:MAG: 3-hydroxyacyl-ACP dehydratase FabZ [Planctomycetes bacterium]|nr:3-hydroxyacyl-ACP dehydratase FabZ [Planctomycetota bacterium]MCA8935450.1 3-hydroxyacyl-ACP dehydratase FabZ [Planctomycetota bacterium]
MNEASPEVTSGALDIQGVLNIAPHRYPFLMVDRVLERTDNKAVGIKNVTYNEPCFTGHFPERPIFPGVLMLEALAQMGGLLVLGREENMGKLALFTGADEVKWRRTVVPGDQIRIEVELLKEKRGLCVVSGTASVDGELACAATVKFMVTEERTK